MARAEARAEERECRLCMAVEDLEIRGALAREERACEIAMKSAITFEDDTVVSVVRMVYFCILARTSIDRL